MVYVYAILTAVPAIVVVLTFLDFAFARSAPGVALAARKRLRAFVLKQVDLFLPMNKDTTGALWPLAAKVDRERFARAVGFYMGLSLLIFAGMYGLHYHEKTLGNWWLWALTYETGIIFMLIFYASFSVQFSAWFKNRFGFDDEDLD